MIKKYIDFIQRSTFRKKLYIYFILVFVSIVLSIYNYNNLNLYFDISSWMPDNYKTFHNNFGSESRIYITVDASKEGLNSFVRDAKDKLPEFELLIDDLIIDQDLEFLRKFYLKTLPIKDFLALKDNLYNPNLNGYLENFNNYFELQFINSIYNDEYNIKNNEELNRTLKRMSKFFMLQLNILNNQNINKIGQRMVDLITFGGPRYQNENQISFSIKPSFSIYSKIFVSDFYNNINQIKNILLSIAHQNNTKLKFYGEYIDLIDYYDKNKSNWQHTLALSFIFIFCLYLFWTKNFLYSLIYFTSIYFIFITILFGVLFLFNNISGFAIISLLGAYFLFNIRFFLKIKIGQSKSNTKILLPFIGVFTLLYLFIYKFNINENSSDNQLNVKKINYVDVISHSVSDARYDYDVLHSLNSVKEIEGLINLLPNLKSRQINFNSNRIIRYQIKNKSIDSIDSKFVNKYIAQIKKIKKSLIKIKKWYFIIGEEDTYNRILQLIEILNQILEKNNLQKYRKAFSIMNHKFFNEYKDRILLMTDRTDLNINNLPDAIKNRHIYSSNLGNMYTYRVKYDNEKVFFGNLSNFSMKVIDSRFYIYTICKYVINNIYFILSLIVASIMSLYYFLNFTNSELK